MGDSVAEGRQQVEDEATEVEIEAEIDQDAGWQEKKEPPPGERKDDFEPENRFHG